MVPIFSLSASPDDQFLSCPLNMDEQQETRNVLAHDGAACFVVIVCVCLPVIQCLQDRQKQSLHTSPWTWVHVLVRGSLLVSLKVNPKTNRLPARGEETLWLKLKTAKDNAIIKV